MRVGRSGGPADNRVIRRCPACANELRAAARFCDNCGVNIGTATPGERKQITVLFADVVGSMELAATLDAERLREIMDELFNRFAVVIGRYGGTVDKFTGDGLMALFGAPIALEDHAIRAGLAALEIQTAARRLAAEVRTRNAIDLAVRVGLNSGEVIAGDVGASGYTAVGHPVGLAQRIESAAPGGGVLCAESTARLIGRRGVLGTRQLIDAKGVHAPVPAFLLQGMATDDPTPSHDLNFHGRADELSAMLAAFTDPRITLITVEGEPGVGKSRLVYEFLTAADPSGTAHVITRCESHSSDVPLDAVSRLARQLVDTATSGGARPSPDAVVLHDLVSTRADGGSPTTSSADLSRLGHVLSNMIRGHRRAGILVIEDVHWIDASSAAVLAEVVQRIKDTASTVVVTFRPGYTGVLRDTASVAVALTPLDGAAAMALAAELIGSRPESKRVAEHVAAASSGNPFYTEEIVRDMAERGLLTGQKRDYRLAGDLGSTRVPATVQSVIAARVDRLATSDKAILTTASVIGSSFDEDVLAAMTPEADAAVLQRLVAAELIRQTHTAPTRTFSFRHPLVRAVCYDSQLSSSRAHAHRQLAAVVEHRNGGAINADAALIAYHRNAAGDHEDAYLWYVNAAEWLRYRDIQGARTCWERAREIADSLPPEADGHERRRLIPRAMLAMTGWMVPHASAEDDRDIDDLRALVRGDEDLVPLALALAGRVTSLALIDGLPRAATALAGELEEIATRMPAGVSDRTEVLIAIATAHYSANDFARALRSTDEIRALEAEWRVDEIAPPTALSGALKILLGDRDAGTAELESALRLGRDDPATYAIVLGYQVDLLVLGFLTPTDRLLRRTRRALRMAESFGDAYTLALARWEHGTLLSHRGNSRGAELLRQARAGGIDMGGSQIDADIARHNPGDPALTAALVKSTRDEIECGDIHFAAYSTAALVDILVRTGTQDDLATAADATARLDAGLTEMGHRALQPWLLRCRATLAGANGDTAGARRLRAEYRRTAARLGASGHIATVRD